MRQFEQIKAILQSHYSLTVIPTQRYNSVNAVFQQYALHADVPVYVWRHDTGLQTLEDEPLIIPDTVSPHDVLEFIQNSLHYAVYLLEEFPYNVNSKTASLFNDIILNTNSINGKIILVSPEFQLDSILQAHTLFVDCSQQAAPVATTHRAPEEDVEMPYIPMEQSTASMR